MNRAERRRLGIRGKAAAVNIKLNEFESSLQQVADNGYLRGVQDGVKKATTVCIAIARLVVHDHFGKLVRKEGRVDSFLREFSHQMELHNQGYFKIDDVRECFKTESGVEFDVKAEVQIKNET